MTLLGFHVIAGLFLAVFTGSAIVSLIVVWSQTRKK